MDLQTSVCILAAASVIASIMNILVCYACNQLALKALEAAKQTNLNAATTLVVVDKCFHQQGAADVKA